MTDDLTRQPAWRLRELMEAKEVSPVEILERHLERIDALEGTLHAFITLDEEGAREQARASESRIMRGDPVGALEGIPMGVKDQFWTKGMRTTGGSLAFADYIPDEDSVHVERVRAAGAIIVGKTNTPEFGLYPRSVGRVAEECRNPWNPELTSGGSSGGSAAAVAAGMLSLAISSDGGGSIRLPAAYNGVVGIHPSNGRTPRHGSFGGALTGSGVGPIARDVRDAATMFQVMAGADPRDPLGMLSTPPDYLAASAQGVEGMRIAWTESFGRTGSPHEDERYVATARAAAERLTELGATVEHIDFDPGDAMALLPVIQGADRYASLVEELWQDPERKALLAPYTLAMFAGTHLLTAADYSRALKEQYWMTRRLELAMRGYDLLLTPATALPAQAATGLATVGPDDPAASFAYSSYTALINSTGFAGASIPAGFVDGLPVGLHLVARPDEESAIFRAARAYESAFPWDAHVPTILGAAV